MNINEHLEQETIHTALDNLKANAGLLATWRQGKFKELDGELDIEIAGKPIKFVLEVKRELRNHHLQRIIDQANGHNNFMILADRILPGVKQELRENHIAYLEGNGNLFIDKKPIFIWLDHNKPLDSPKEKPNRAFTKTGLQVVFLFLTDPAFINQPYRIIAQTAGVALGNVNNVIHGLQEYGFLLRRNDNEYILNNKKDLLDKWSVNYQERLKPALHIGNFRFINTNGKKDWNDFDLNTKETVWGAEPGGDILTNYLRPETLTIYTNEPRKNLMEQFRIVPDELGNIKAYRKFWTHTTPVQKMLPQLKLDKAAPPILVYADLMNTNDKRCMETANLIYEQYIEPKL